ncbi:diacylglycerol O-acyltransferase 1-1 isoform X2 [Aegilops tauschii subsp. strangulata]|uniref:O-acyltransferase n=2 Tax=Aegilops tauschii subsp. strangulata TaxID=200361 RepID=A0A452Y6J8_AEGTS|nr:diacylglycerol O-acyltransferase 1-1 isoform X2 [Aegilops tauschii subsp. strangulata]
MEDSNGAEIKAPPPVHRRPPRPRGGGFTPEGFVAALRRRLSSGAAVAARASFAADSGDESGPPEPSSSHRRRDSSGDTSSTGGPGDFTAFSFRAAAPVHRKAKESPLSSDAIFKQSHAGLFNLCIVVLVAVNGRLIIENLMKYGLLIRAGFWFNSTSLRDWPLLMCCLSLPAFPLGAFSVEQLAFRNVITDAVATCLHIILTTAEIVYPVLVILMCDSAVVSGFLLMFIACIVWLKLVSFAHTNHDIRQLTISGKKVDNAPSTADMDNLQAPTLGSLIYFMMAPTLCYQPSYPRTENVRKGWLIRQIILYLIFTGIQGFIIEQYINPIVVNSQHPLKGGLLNAVETVLRLSLPNVYLWLCMFYCFFHLWLNILAEILRFGDREFYKDWWNAKTIDEYWRKWNMPVHKWIVRHIYFPCMRSGISKEVAVFVSFFVSAVLHELVVAVPCRILKFWAFLGIMLQIPLITLTSCLKSKFRDTMAGNMIFWFFFCIYGQPMCVLLYYHDVMNRIGKTE